MALSLAPNEPQPVTITKENIFDVGVTPFEVWLFGLVRQDPRRYLQLVDEWVATLPAYDGQARPRS